VSLDAVLATGEAGYVGAHTCKALADAGFKPIVFDNLSTGHRSFVRWGPLVEGDIGDKAAVFAALTAQPVRAVLHFAACAYVGIGLRPPQILREQRGRVVVAA